MARFSCYSQIVGNQGITNITSGANRALRSRAHITTSLALVILSGVCVCPKASAQGVSVLTRSYNNQRTGANLSETLLNPPNVSSTQFGKLFSLAVDDQVFAGILYVSAVPIGGSIHNVIYVATVNNSVYAFDADSLGPPLWMKNFNGSGRPSNNTDFGAAGSFCPLGGYYDFRGKIGIVGTPVIDGAGGTIYFVTRTVEVTGVVQRLHAVDITSGFERANSPKLISASVPGTGDGGTTVVFNSGTQNQRPALAFSQGSVYIAWASYCDITPYHGWVMSYDGKTLSQLGVFNTTPNGSQAGIWMAAAGIAFDAGGNLYLTTGNGTADATQGFGESVVKLAPNTLNRLDFYTASNYNTLNAGDTDFGSGGPAMLPGYNLLVTGGKEGRLYLLNTNNLGGLAPGDVQIPQVFQAVDPTVRPSTTHHIHASNIVWNSPQGLNVYVWGENDFLRGYRFNSATQTLNTAPFASGAILPPVGMPGGIMSLSANGAQPGTGILWASTPRNGDANEYTAPGGLYAFNAETLALLWQSTAVGDDSLNFSKGSPIVVANGKVYAASLSRFVSVYGLRTTIPPSQNLALNKAATGSTPCNANEGPAQAVNGSYSLGLTDKWCSAAPNSFLQVDLGAPTLVDRFIVEHAGAGGGEAFPLNTVAFNIQVSTDGVKFTTVVNVTGNVDSITTHDVTPTIARYVKLNVITPNQGVDSVTRIFEFQVYKTPDYSVDVAPISATVTAGSGTTLTVTQTAIGSFNGNVSYTLSGLPAGATANVTPSAIAGSGSSVLTIATTSATAAGTYTLVVNGQSGALQHATNVNLSVVKAVDFGLAVSPASSSVTAGSGGVFTATVASLSGFAGIVTLSTTGIPAGSTASFVPASINTVGSSLLTIATGAATAAGKYSITVSGTSGGLIHTATLSLAVVASGTTGSSVPANLSSVFNRTGIVADGSTFTLGLDGYGFAYSSNLLGTSRYINGTPYMFGSAGTLNAVSSATVPLPGGNFAALRMLATGLSGVQVAQVFTVKYTDGTTSSFTQSLSDWFIPSGFAGEAVASAMAYRDVYYGGKDNRVFNVYGYSFPLNQAKTVSSIVLPANNNVVVLAMSLIPAVQVSLAATYNRNAFDTDGTVFASGGIDGYGFAYSGNLLGATKTVNGTLFRFGPSNVPNSVANATIVLPAGNFSALKFLATGVGGLQPSQMLTVNYTDGTSTPTIQGFSDWFVPGGFPGESPGITMAYRDQYNGTIDARPFQLYSYSVPLNVVKTLKSVTLPANPNVVFLAVTAIP